MSNTPNQHMTTEFFVGLPPEKPDGTPTLTITDLKKSIGEEFVGDWFKIDPISNDSFCQSTYIDVIYDDSNPQAVYEEHLIEGFYLVSLIDALKARVYKDDPAFYALNYGSNRLRFVEQVTLNSILQFSCVVESVMKKHEGYLVELECKISIKGIERPALIYSILYYLAPMPIDHQ
ncbi:hypothetical protein [Pseudomonas syringae group genomosp. 3]|uniref:hypothetical protein n=1 Tax=Pseudomonas syringae group genomosp. 3 TaxID=251701 RepID=UPI000F00739A|nr:hypothetical protein [Pseudomonas syringae group genomosp. 3]